MSQTKTDGIHPLDYTLYENGAWQAMAGAITEEALVCIHLNGRELATFMCTPREPDELALGFLRAEGLIHSLAEVRALTISEDGRCVDVWLDHAVELPARRIITSGCGGGVTFDDMRARHTPLNTNATVTPEQIFARMRELYQAGDLYSVTQGIHTSALSDGERLLLVAEDVGRHNTIDRLWGKALKQNISTEGNILLATGRISSEMLGKAAKMGVPIVVSRTSATSLSVELGRAWNITVVGYARRNSLRVYTALHRIALEAQTVAPA
ncbi:MAG: formate dehydrogenase accessory sulfurtransferase FdhD [Chloroflexi bacterium]|nr:formate dehydrogenase accessory sulfurtransferase FdhD [Chloroflexota bacterium]